GKPADPSMDVYTLAASCYCAVTGVLPESAMNRKLYGRGLVAPRQHRGTLSQGLNAAILAGMELEAGDRPNLSEWLRLFQPQESRVKTPSGFTKSSQDQNVNAGIAQPIAQVWDIDAVPLKSEKGVDYTRLRDLLKSGQWKEADLETGKLMERALGTSDWSKIYQEEKLLLKFPCADLKTIDQLWVRASQGRYGFSVQKEIYVKCGAKPDGNYPGDTIWYKFCNEVGWRVKNSWVSYGDLDWGGTGVPGHLPVLSCYIACYYCYRLLVGGVFSRIETCEV
ncbi:MAG: GUN4 domain-containing protein, partial [Prochlorothrix sp.]